MPAGKQVSTLVVEPMFRVLVNVVEVKETEVIVVVVVVVITDVKANRFLMT